MSDNDLQQKIFSLRINERFYNRLHNHIHLLKKLESRSHSKQRWIEDAVKEKLETAEKNEDNNIPKDKFLSFKIPEHLCKRMQQQIEHAKKFKISYSYTKWLLEAMLEKLEREDEKAKRLLKQLKDLSENVKNHPS